MLFHEYYIGLYVDDTVDVSLVFCVVIMLVMNMYYEWLCMSIIMFLLVNE